MKNQKMLLLVNLSENVQQFNFLGSCYFNLNFSKNVPDYIDPSGHFVFYKFFCNGDFMKKVLIATWALRDR